MFSGTIFDNKNAAKQTYPFEYLHILGPLNVHTELTITLYDKLIRFIDGTRSLRDID